MIDWAGLIAFVIVAGSPFFILLFLSWVTERDKGEKRRDERAPDGGLVRCGKAGRHAGLPQKIEGEK